MPSSPSLTTEAFAGPDLFRAFMDHAPLVAWITDPTGRILYANKGYRKVVRLGNHSTDVSVHEVFPIQHSKTYMRHNELVLELKTAITTVVPCIDSSGHTSFYRVHKFPVEVDGVTCVGGWATPCAEEEYKGKLELL